MKRFLRVLAVALLAVSLASTASAASRKSRDLVFEDDDTPTASQGQSASNEEEVAVRTILDLTRDGKTSAVPPTHTFRSGDRVKLRYAMNADGYVYWLAKMSSGKYQVLFPTPQTGMDNYVKRNAENTIPVKGSFRFDDTPGTESLLLVYATDKIPELEQAVAEAAKAQGKVDQGAGKVASIEDRNRKKRTSRDLVFEDEDEDEVNTKRQKAPKGEPLVALFELKHQ